MGLIAPAVVNVDKHARTTGDLVRVGCDLRIDCGFWECVENDERAGRGNDHWRGGAAARGGPAEVRSMR